MRIFYFLTWDISNVTFRFKIKRHYCSIIYKLPLLSARFMVDQLHPQWKFFALYIKKIKC